MKKLLGILVLGLLLSHNAYAMDFICKNTQRPNAYVKFNKLIDKKNMQVITTVQYSAEEAKSKGAHSNEFSYNLKIYEIDDNKIIYGQTNLDVMKQMYQRQIYNERYDSTNPKWTKKWIKKYGPLEQIRLLVTFYYKEDNSPIQIKLFDKKNNVKDDTSLLVCMSEKSFQKSKQAEIKKASNRMKEDIKPFKNMCKNIGYQEGTEKFADCVKDLYLKKLDAENQSQTTITAVPKKKIDPSVWDDLLNISKGMSEGKSFTESLGNVGSSSSSNTSKIQCFKSGERVSGTNKICSYNCMGSEVVQNISSTSICALSINLN